MTAYTAHKGGEPSPIKTLHPFRKGSVLEALIKTYKQDGSRGRSIETSDTDKWRLGLKADKLGTVNSADRKKNKTKQNKNKTKYANTQAA